MVDFKKKLGKSNIPKLLDPVEIYGSLDRSSAKGPLRPAQLAVLSEWQKSRRTLRDVVLKLHTGQGKTLVGLLLLQAKLNEGSGPALYICPSNFLVDQTVAEAEAFGFSVARINVDIPDSFVNSRAILVCSVQSVFNGMSKFGLDSSSQDVGALVLDDAHACMDVMQGQMSIRIPHDEGAYGELLSLFEPALKQQGVGTFADLREHAFDALLPVPYWEWLDKTGEVATILSKHKASKSIRYAWPLLKDSLHMCHCVVSGTSLEIAPHVPPIDRFGSFVRATHRVCMSATITDDSFLVKGLHFPAAVIRDPLIYTAERWSGEKMILIPSLIDESLDRSAIVTRFAKAKAGRRFGVVALCPSFKRAEDWKASGADVAKTETIYAKIARLREGDCQQSLAVANRYDGIDLPDSSCRVLIMDSKPFSESLIERYLERCVGNGEAIAARTARIIEQGLGRSVRGEKDYCAIILTGPDLIKQIRTAALRRYFSAQTRMQIEIGLEIASDARAEGGEPMQALINLVNQCLRRDDGWKEFYVDRMNALEIAPLELSRLDALSLELLAEQKAEQGFYDDAAGTIQKLSDKFVKDDAERGWYLQEMARLTYLSSKSKANTLQIAAHKKNRYLLRPKEGMVVTRMAMLSQKRVDLIIQNLVGFATYESLSVAVDEVVSKLTFGVDAERFEDAVNRLGQLLGFASERPDAEWKEGPDNLWCIRDGDYLLIECKSEVLATRAEISKYESEQMNASAAWFAKTYPGCRSRNLIVHPAKRLQSSATFIAPVQVVRRRQLDLLSRNIRRFFGEFKNIDFKDLSPHAIQSFLSTHELGTEDFLSKYGESVK